MEYQITEDKFKQYINKCKEIIKNIFFKETDLNEVTRNHRLHMINIKLDHTMRMIEQIIKINEKLDLKFDFRLVIQVAILYHDIGRFSQATWSNTFNDEIYIKLNKPFIHHGDEGRYIFLNNDFKIDEQYIHLIGNVIYHHVHPEKMPNAKYQFDKKLSNLSIHNIITGRTQLNDAEMKVAVLITQLVADIDKIDILYQQLEAHSEMIKDYIPDNSLDTLDNIAKYWKIDKSEIIEYNQLNEITYKPQIIKIPIKNMELSQLEVPPHIKEMFYNNTWIPLTKLKEDRHWNFISIRLCSRSPS